MGSLLGIEVFMKVNSQRVTVSGVEPSQHYVGISNDTGVYASTNGIRVTGVPDRVALVEVRKAPSKSFETPTDEKNVQAAACPFGGSSATIK